MRLSGFQPVGDPAILARLPEAARTNVRQVSLKALGITDFGQMRSRGFGRPVTPSHCELFFNGRPMTLAAGPTKVNGSASPATRTRERPRTNTAAKTGKLEEGFTYSGDHPAAGGTPVTCGSTATGPGTGPTPMSAWPPLTLNTA